MWYSDIHNSRGAGTFNIQTGSGNNVDLVGDGAGNLSGGEEEELSGEDLYAVDNKSGECYGCWRHGYKKGITFEKPRPLDLVRQGRKL